MRLLAAFVAFTLCSDAMAQSSEGVGDGGPAAQAALIAPEGVAVDGRGAIYISERAGHRVRRVDPRTGVITTIAGTGVSGYSGDGGPGRLAQVGQVGGLAVDANGHIYIGDLWNSRIRRVHARTGVITTIAGTGEAGYSGDGGPATRAQISAAFDIEFDRAGNLVFTDTENHVIRRINSRTGVISTIAGTGARGFSGDGGPATQATFSRPHCVLITPQNDMIICDSFNQRIRRIDAATGRIDTIVGAGLFGAGGDNGPATDAAITWVGDMLLDRDGNLMFSDIATHRIRRVDRRTGVITTIAGIGRAAFEGDGGPATSAAFELPGGLAYAADGGLLVADMWNGRIRRIGPDGVMNTVVGSRLSPETPEWRFRVNYSAAPLQATFNNPPALDLPDAARVTVQSFTLERGGGFGPSVVRVAIPPGARNADRFPVVVIVHGRNNQEVRASASGGFLGWARLLAASGFVAVLPDHRLGQGVVSAAGARDDVAAAIAALRGRAADFNADPSRMCFLTFSEGIAVATPLLQGDTTPRCVAAFYPTVDVTDQRANAWTFETPELRRDMSLLHRGFSGPMFVARGGADRADVNEPLAQFAQTPSVIVITHASGGHGFERAAPDAESARIIGEAIAFLERSLR
jgi:acetyl esterase/lipase/sugar lactone lactonase YvrE